MSTETTNKKIKIDNGTTFGRTYTDKAVDALLKNVGDIWLDITPYLGENVDEGITSISQEGYDLVWNAFYPIADNPSNKYAGIMYSGYKLLFNELIISDKTSVNFIVNTDEEGKKNCIKVSIYYDKSVEIKRKSGSSSSVFDITPYLTSSTSISVEGYNALREFVISNKGGISKVLVNSDYFYYTLCQLNESGMLFTKVGGEDHESGDTVVVSLMVTSDGSCTFISNAYTPVKANPTETVTGTLSKIRIGNGVYSVVDEAKVNELINSKIGDINSILDNINGEVI